MSKNSRSDILLEIERERDRIRYRLKKFKEIIKEVEAKERRAYYILGMLPAMDLDEHWSQDMYEAKTGLGKFLLASKTNKAGVNVINEVNKKEEQANFKQIRNEEQCRY
ncbi:MAG TPA: hypothetical protein GX687_04540 [Clostridia bacterium]|jgi:hypothetical protein|nr:hypothetical protein [Clostridia bacterium]